MSKKILLADDAAFVRMMLKDILRKAGYEVVGESSTCSDAVAKYKALKPDLVFMDIIMPETDGLQAAKEILESDPDARIITMAEGSFLTPSLEAGAKDFVQKPFRPDQILGCASRALGE